MDDSMETMRKQQEIYNLLAELQSSVSEIGDWKIIKHQEYLLAGIESPYDITELNSQRQAVRDRISELREELKK